MLSFFEPAESAPSHISRSARVEHGAISMIHDHDSLYYHSIEKGSHKWQGGGCDSNNVPIEFLRKTLYFVSVILSRFVRIHCRLL